MATFEDYYLEKIASGTFIESEKKEIMAVIAEDPPQLGLAFLRVLALDDGAFIHADADRYAGGLARVDHRVDLLAVGDVAGIEADLVHAGLDRLDRALEVKVHIGDDGHPRLAQDVLQRCGVLTLGHRHADDVRAGRGQAIDLRHARVDFMRGTRRHRLHRDRPVAADSDEARVLVAHRDRTCLASALHRRLL